MGRPSSTQALSVWTNGVRVGTWRIGGRSGMELQYERGWMQSPMGRPLSLSLPFGLDDTPLRGPAVEHYFDNLLPDSDLIRRRIAVRFKTSSAAAFDLLRAIGRDCVGSVQLLDVDAVPLNVEKIEGMAMTEGEVEQHLLHIVASPSVFDQQTADDALRISLAGAQEKTALLWHQNQWMRPQGTTPSTHILKLPLGLVGNRKVDLRHSVDNEWLCLALLSEYGVPVCEADILHFGSQRVLAVKRFDRQLHSSGSWWMRLPQEDFCQALGLSSHLKYEVDGGPGMKDIAAILMQSVQAKIDLRNFMKAQILFWLLAATDGHAKNFSIQILPQGRFKLAPLYDVMSIWPMEGKAVNQWSIHQLKLAMAFQGKSKHYQHKDIQVQHLIRSAYLCGVTDQAQNLLDEIIAETASVMTRVQARLPKGISAAVVEKTCSGIAASLRKLQKAG